MSSGNKTKLKIETPDESKKAVILQHEKNGELACAAAFEIVNKHNIPADEVGSYADLLDIRLIKCRMGLYGYKPENKIVKPAESVTPELKQAIEARLVDGKLFCKNAWEIASNLGLSKMAVSCACEALEIKMKKCQLGAF